MKEAALKYLACPICRRELTLQAVQREAGEILKGWLKCGHCEHGYEITQGVPRLLPAALEGDRLQTQESYSEKWARQPDYGHTAVTRRFHQRWYLSRYGWGTLPRFRRFMARRQAVLDAGTGLGRDLLWYSSLTAGDVVGLDVSSSVDLVFDKVLARPKGSLVQGDILALPFRRDAFDFVACDFVLPCVAEPEGAVVALASCVRPGGYLAFYTYRRKGPAREWCDDFLRAHISKLPADEAWEVCRSLTEFGKALARLRAKVRITRDIPLLQIPAGTYDVQRLVHYKFMKCFWNEAFTYDQNNLVNFDWYHPAYTFRHTVEEVRGWVARIGFRLLVLDDRDPSGISVLCGRPLRRVRRKRAVLKEAASDEGR